MNYPKAIKAFYMRVNDDVRTVAAMDVLAPGIGEIIGGSQREERLEVLHGAACRLRPRPGFRRGHPRLRHRPRQRPRRDPLPADARQRAVLRILL
jgi:asparaginyl-tRNA synthetase